MKPLAEKLIARSVDFVDFVRADMEQFRRIGRLDDTAIAEVKLTQATSICLLRQRVMGRSAVSLPDRPYRILPPRPD